MTHKPLFLLPGLVLMLLPTAAQAYVGPGAGLGMLGTLVAVIAAVLVALFGLVAFPITVIRKKRKAAALQRQEAAEGTTEG
jgi:hypothetical protein